MCSLSKTHSPIHRTNERAHCLCINLMTVWSWCNDMSFATGDETNLKNLINLNADIFTYSVLRFFGGWIAKTARRKIHLHGHRRGRGTLSTKLQWWMAYSIIWFCAQIALSHVHRTSLRALKPKHRTIEFESLSFCLTLSQLSLVCCTVARCRRYHSHELELIDWLCLTFHFSCIPHSSYIFFLFSIYPSVLSLFLRDSLLRNGANRWGSMNDE